MKSKSLLLLLPTLFAWLVATAPWTVASAAPKQASVSSHRRDSPMDAPPHAKAPRNSRMLAAPGETSLTYALPKARFRVNDGGNLDQYLSREEGPITFSMDLQGFNASASANSKVTLRVYDVDSAGGPSCGPEVDKVYLNGREVGVLTGADSQWSNVTFSIPAGVLNPGVNNFKVDIDTQATGCWAVEVDWAEVEIDFNIALTEVSSLDDIPLQKTRTGPLYEDPIWKAVFDDKGQAVPPSTGNKQPDYPIASYFSGHESFTYKYKIESWPGGTNAQPGWEPKVEYTWEFVGQNVAPGQGEQQGWENEFYVTLPSRVGKFNLKVVLKIYVKSGQEFELVRTESREHTVYVTWGEPDPSILSLDSTPVEKWLDVATSWAGDAKTAREALLALVYREYENPLKWVYGYYRSPGSFSGTANIFDMVENGADKRGDCESFRDVWMRMASLLGVYVNPGEYRHKDGFVTSTKPALDGNFSANAQNAESKVRDRWFFGAHFFGMYRGLFYDPTFGRGGFNDERSVAYCLLGPESKVPAVCEPSATGGGTLWVKDSDQPMFNGWDQVTYSSKPPSLLPLSSALSASGSSAVPGLASFTGQESDQGYDADFNGLFEHLQVNVGVSVAQSGVYVFKSSLEAADGSLVATGDLDPKIKKATSVTSLQLDAGVHSIPLYFNGRRIRATEKAGPYTVKIELRASQGALADEATFTTAAYSPASFQGLLTEIRGVRDSAVNTDTLPGDDLLRVSVDTETFGSGKVTLNAQLFAGDTYLANARRTLQPAVGTGTVELDFSGKTIANRQLDGPYEVYLSVQDANYTDDSQHTTAAYLYTRFQPPTAFFSGKAEDLGVDNNGNGRFEELKVSARVAALVAGRYTFRGTLRDNAGNAIASLAQEVNLDASRTPVSSILRFDGQAIAHHRRDGPYLVDLSLVDGKGATVAFLQHTSRAYSSRDFEQPAASFTRSLTDEGTDLDGDSLYDVLRVRVGVEVVAAGSYAIEAFLEDPQHQFVTSVKASVPLVAGVQTVNLDFPGEAIRNHGADGPYRVMTLTLKDGAGVLLDSMMEAHTTRPYKANQFQVSGLLIRGTQSDRVEDLNGNGLYDVLTFEFDARIPAEGSYDFNARLVDSSGKEIAWASDSRLLQPGVHHLALSFSGRTISEHNVDGPYYVRNLSIYSYFVDDSLVEVHTTKPYAASGFESLTVAFESRESRVHEGNSAAALSVVLDEPAQEPVTVQYATRGGSASAGADYLATRGTLTFAPGELVKSIEVPLMEDAVPESDETIVLVLSNPTHARLGANSSATLTIVSNDKLSFSGNEYSVPEGVGQATFTVVLNAPSSQPVTVGYSTHPGSALAGADYLVTQGTLTFAPGETSKSFQVTILEDSLAEAREDFRLYLSNPTNAALATPISAMVYIPANDGLALDKNWYEVPERAGMARLTVRLNGPSSQVVTVDYATQDSGARSGRDYTARSGTLTFTPGQTEQVIEVPILDDSEDEQNEQFKVSLNNPANASLSGITRATLSIVDDD